jgi:diaminohydroxyphosphoribosylaminopyrimidine deaminase / 5-amino-6-(5-phosphoribosylamino)uracil reductase
MRRALRLAQRAFGRTSPNPLVGAVLVKGGAAIGQGWHRQAGEPHAEIEALRDARRRGQAVSGATLYVTLEPCSTQGRTPPCTAALIEAGLRRVVVAATDPNPAHAGKAFSLLRRAGIEVKTGVLAEEASQLNEAFNHWIVEHTPFVMVKAAMSLDGKIATASGDSKWITGEKARAYGMKLRMGADAILVGVNTVLADDPSLTVRGWGAAGRGRPAKRLRRIILDSRARTPLTARVMGDSEADLTTVVVTRHAPPRRVAALARRVNVLTAPSVRGWVGLRWLLKRLGAEGVTSLLVDGGGEVNASFLLERLAHRVVFFYAPRIIGGAAAPKGVAGKGIRRLADCLVLEQVHWRKLGADLLMTARVSSQARFAAEVQPAEEEGRARLRL